MSKTFKIKVHNINEVPSDICKSNMEYNINFNKNEYFHEEEEVKEQSTSVSDNSTQYFTRFFDRFNRISDLGKDIFYDISNVYYKNKSTKNYDKCREIIINKKD